MNAMDRAEWEESIRLQAQIDQSLAKIADFEQILVKLKQFEAQIRDERQGRP